jgi:hypothetical protein
LRLPQGIFSFSEEKFTLTSKNMPNIFWGAQYKNPYFKGFLVYL